MNKEIKETAALSHKASVYLVFYNLRIAVEAIAEMEMTGKDY